MNRGTFYVADGSWAKYGFEYLWGTFQEWWEHRERMYDLDNAKAKHFWSEFLMIKRNK